MRIEHLAIWTTDIERLREFYGRWFEAISNARYENHDRGFASYFLSFEGDTRLELMQRTDFTETQGHQRLGYAHVAISLGSEARVDRLTSEMAAAGVHVESAPRKTGDGYYESVVLDPDGNRVELTT